MGSAFPSSRYEERRKSDRRAAHIVKAISELDDVKTVIDIGANRGFFSYAIHKELGIRTIAVDKPGKILFEQPGLENIQLIEKEIKTFDDIRQLGRFDVVLSLSVLHHMPRWPEILEAKMAMARKALIVEVPSREEKQPRWIPADTARLEKAVRNLGGELVCKSPANIPKYKRNTWMVRV